MHNDDYVQKVNGAHIRETPVVNKRKTFAALHNEKVNKLYLETIECRPEVSLATRRDDQFLWEGRRSPLLPLVTDNQRLSHIVF